MIIITAQIILWATVLLALSFSAVMDLRLRIIPNEIVLLVAACGVALTLLNNPATLWISLLTGLLVLLGLGVVAHFDVIGGGDVKMIAATTLLVPLDGVGSLLAAIVIAGGILGCIYLAVRYALKRNPVMQSAAGGDFAASNTNQGGFLGNERKRIVEDEPMPYALAILAGVLNIVISEPPQCFSAISLSF